MDNKLNVGNEINSDFEKVVEIEEHLEEKKKPFDKKIKAKVLRDRVEVLVVSANREVEKVHNLVSENGQSFLKKRKLFVTEVLSKLFKQLKEVKYDYQKDVIREPFELSLNSNKNKFTIQNISSGRFSALLLSLFGTVGTASVWLYFATKKTGIILDTSMVNPTLFENILENEKLAPIFQWISGGLTNGKEDGLLGLVILLGSSALVGIILYNLYIAIKEKKNFKLAENSFNKTDDYVKKQQISKGKIMRVGQHIDKLSLQLLNYRVLLEEQSAKLQRIIHIEGKLAENFNYENSSQEIMRDTEKLIRRVEKLIFTSVTKNGKVNEDSIYALMEANATYEGFVAKIYN